MNDKEKTAVVIATVASIIATVNYINSCVMSDVNGLRSKLKKNLQIQAMNVAVKRVQDRVRRGGFDHLTMDNLMTDFDFETIAERFEK